MKKYLMIAVAALAFASCANEDVYDPDAKTKEKEAKYQAVFEAEFGKIAKGVNWGFEAQKGYFSKDGKWISATTRGVDDNNNMWGSYVDVPKPLTEAQKAKVMKYFNTFDNLQGISINWCDFFVQQVGSSELGQPHMNQLVCGNEDLSKADHVHNFNDADAGWKDPVLYADGTTGKDKINFITDGATQKWGWHNSLEDGDSETGHWYYNFVIIPGDRIQKEYNEGGDDADVSGMFFVAFDYECHGTTAEKQINPDGFYNDWVVRVNPGEYLQAQRVFVEDLKTGDLDKVTSTDWDFNDAVFDAFINYNQYWHDGDYAVITVRAAGGTLPLTVAGQEVHGLLGEATNIMINTNAATVGPHKDGVIPVQFRIPASQITSNNAKDIPVFVNGSTELKAEQSAATQKLAGPTSVQWVNERTNIKHVFSNFVPFCQKKTEKWWE